MRPRSWNMRRRICTCRCCSRCGPDNGKAICCGFRGQPTTARTSAFGNRKAGSRRDPGRRAAEGGARRDDETLPIILTNSDGKPWTPDGFRASWGKACKGPGSSA